jgi:DNA-binding CsgD family transcriptional regulator
MTDDVPSTELDISLLTDTERRVLEAFADGKTRRETARSLRLAPSTIGHALTAATEKLGVESPGKAAIRYEHAKRNIDLHQAGSLNADAFFVS